MSLGVVLVTGASHGIGLATAEHLANNGYKVYATCRDPLKADHLQKLSKRIANISILPLDVTSEESVDKAISEIFEKEGTIDVVVNNAGFGIYGPTEVHTIEESHKILDTNFLGVLRVNQAVVPIMREQRRGRIINIGSIAGSVPSKNLAIYSASKAALASITANDAHHLAKWNIKVCLVQAGAVTTSFEFRTPSGSHFPKTKNPYSEVLAHNRKEWKQKMDGGQPPSEVAKVILKAIQSPEPDLWYQTSEVVENAMSGQYKDLTGKSQIPKSTIPILAKL